MLREVNGINQQELPYHKRWFRSSEANLFIWELDNAITMVQYSFEFEGQETILVWEHNKKFSCYSVRVEHSDLGMKVSELVSLKQYVEPEKILTHFLKESKTLPTYIISKIQEILSQGAARE